MGELPGRAISLRVGMSPGAFGGKSQREKTGKKKCRDPREKFLDSLFRPRSILLHALVSPDSLALSGLSV